MVRRAGHQRTSSDLPGESETWRRQVQSSARQPQKTACPSGGSAAAPAAAARGSAEEWSSDLPALPAHEEIMHDQGTFSMHSDDAGHCRRAMPGAGAASWAAVRALPPACATRCCPVSGFHRRRVTITRWRRLTKHHCKGRATQGRGRQHTDRLCKGGARWCQAQRVCCASAMSIVAGSADGAVVFMPPRPATLGASG